MAVNLEAFRQAEWERMSFLSIAVLLAYEYLLQLDNEATLFWMRSWNLSKFLFLWSRYFSLLNNAVNVYFFLLPHPSFKACLVFFHTKNAGTAIQVTTTHVILGIRLHAMYGRELKVGCFLLFLLAVEVIVAGVLFGARLIATNNPYDKLFICADSDPLNGSHWIMYYWVLVCFIELCLMALAVYKAWLNRNSTALLLRALTQDSMRYFTMIFGIYILNLLLWATNRITLNELGTSFSGIPVILANRLLIDIRSSCYKDREIPVNLSTCEFRSPDASSSPTASCEDREIPVNLATFESNSLATSESNSLHD